jgi:hypothetical protein
MAPSLRPRFERCLPDAITGLPDAAPPLASSVEVGKSDLSNSPENHQCCRLDCLP